MLLRQVILARDAHVRLTGRGPPTRYGIVLLSAGDGFRFVTPTDSVGCHYGAPPFPHSTPRGGLTAGMLRQLAAGIAYVQGSTAALVEPPAEDAEPDRLVEALHLVLMVYPHAGRPPVFSALASTVYPEHLETEPLVLTMEVRPDGWPP